MKTVGKARMHKRECTSTILHYFGPSLNAGGDARRGSFSYRLVPKFYQVMLGGNFHD